MVECVVLREASSNAAKHFKQFFAPMPRTTGGTGSTQVEPPQTIADTSAQAEGKASKLPQVMVTDAGDQPVFYLSDLSDEDDGDLGDDEGDDEGDNGEEQVERMARSATETPREAIVHVTKPPAPKRRKLAVPVRVARAKAVEARRTAFEAALKDVQRTLKKKDAFKDTNGPAGLQAYRARAIESTLIMVLRSKRTLIDASERAAESHRFAARWGGRLVRRWVRTWVDKRQLPTSQRGRHAKAWSLLNDPAVANEIRAYLRSNKWAVDPQKLADFTQQKLLPEAADKYLQHVLSKEMPRGLKKYLEIELFPRIHFKVGKGISLRTARRWLHKEGFRYMSYRKGLYFDGHERPDVVHYRQTEFLPKMEEYRARLVEYAVGDVEKQLSKSGSERPLVLVAHDEMTAQAHDGKRAGWVHEGE